MNERGGAEGTIEAVVVTPDAPARLALGKAPAPVPAPSEAVVRVAATSLNSFEPRYAQRAEPGSTVGEDVAGTVVQAAADGSGPTTGTRVIGYVDTGSWAEEVAVPTDTLAPLPDGVSLTEAATLPTAGLSALYAVERGGSLLGRRVLVTGASGGIGHLAVQLAHLAGGRVVAQMRNPDRVVAVREESVDAIVVGDDAGDRGPYHLIVDVVGGDLLARALGWLEPDGVAVACGAAGGQMTVTLDLARFREGSLYRQKLTSEFRRFPASVALERLGRLLGDGLLVPHIAIEASWTEVGDIAQRQSDRAYAGKAVLTLE
jgi:NADPH:quinone reductase-like Zn-dependent oxidoreductase